MISYKKIKSQIKRQNKLFERQYSEVIKSLEEDFDNAISGSISDRYILNNSNMDVNFLINSLLNFYQDPEPNSKSSKDKESRQSNFLYAILDIMKNRLIKKGYKIEKCSLGYEYVVINVRLDF